MDMERSREQYMDQLREAILRALQEGELVPPELMEKMLKNPDLSQNQELRDLIDQIIQRMEEEGYIHAAAVRAGDASAFANSRRPDRAKRSQTSRRALKSRTKRSTFSDSKR